MVLVPVNSQMIGFRVLSWKKIAQSSSVLNPEKAKFQIGKSEYFV